MVQYLPDFLFKLLLCYKRDMYSTEQDWFKMAGIIWREYRVAGFTEQEWLPFLLNRFEIQNRNYDVGFVSPYVRPDTLFLFVSKFVMDGFKSENDCKEKFKHQYGKILTW